MTTPLSIVQVVPHQETVMSHLSPSEIPHHVQSLLISQSALLAVHTAIYALSFVVSMYMSHTLLGVDDGVHAPLLMSGTVTE